MSAASVVAPQELLTGDGDSAAGAAMSAASVAAHQELLTGDRDIAAGAVMSAASVVAPQELLTGDGDSAVPVSRRKDETMQAPSNESLQKVYGQDAERACERFEELVDRFGSEFAANTHQLSFFSSPGRTEIIGNHTDHNGGKILAASITMDTIGAAAPNDSDVVRIASAGYDLVEVDLTALADMPHGGGTTPLVAGMFEAMLERGFVVRGFDATVSTEVIPAAGVSSSASFEMLVCAIVNHLFNDGRMAIADCARIGQHAENVWWGKGSGLMDQMACGVGGTCVLDFADGVDCERVDFSFEDLGCELVLVNTGKGHADLSEEYSSVPNEMRAVAQALGGERLCSSSLHALVDRIETLRPLIQNDRALLRALHFYEECARVDEAVKSLAAGEKERLLSIITASGNSSWKWLQNATVPGSREEQSLPLALALTEIYLDRVGRGACRLHGGGFAGVIMCVVPKDASAGYRRLMSRIFGSENVYLTNIRSSGAVRLR